MAIRNLRLEGDEILKKKSREIETIDEKIQILIDDMIETMHKRKRGTRGGRRLPKFSESIC